MSFDYVITPLFGTADDAPALRAALAIGRRFEAHVEIQHARIDPAASVYVMGQGVSGALVDQMLEASRREVEERSARAHEAFAHETAGVTRADEPPETKAFTVGWRELNGRPAECVGCWGRLADLVVAARPSDLDDVEAVLTLEAVLFEARRPLLLVPPQWKSGIGNRVTIGWDGSAQASRAVAEAMGLIATAEQVTVLTVTEGRKQRADPADLVRALAWRGIRAAGRRVDRAGGTPGASLLAEASEAGSDLLVMGGYGHGRLREFVLGGATREIFRAAALPVFMSH